MNAVWDAAEYDMRPVIQAPQPRTCTPRQIQVLSLLAQEYSFKQIAKKLGICERTVEHHIYNAKYRMGFRTKMGLIVYMATHDMLDSKADSQDSLPPLQ